MHELEFVHQRSPYPLLLLVGWPFLQVKSNFRKFTENLIGDLVAAQDDDELLQGIDWRALSEQTNFDKHLDKELPGASGGVSTPLCFSWTIMRDWHVPCYACSQASAV